MGKIYVASRLTNSQRAKEIQNRFIAEGCTITYDWTTHGQAYEPDQLKYISKEEERGVIEADVLFMVFPAGHGSHWEAGLARGLQISGKKIEIILLLDHKQPVELKSFYYGPTIKIFYDEDEAIEHSLKFVGISGEERDDTGLESIICPHCKQTLPVPQIQAFQTQQLVYLKCEMCNKGITKQQISDTYHERRA